MRSENRPWRVPVSVEDIPEAGRHYELAADESTRAAVAHAAGLRSLPQLGAMFDLTRRGAGIAAKGEVKARVGQTCVVTLDPIENEIHESIDLVFSPTSEFAGVGKRTDEPAEPLENGVIDLGAIATEFLMLGLDPYPRKPGVEFASMPGEQRGESPFVALAGLKKRP